MTTIDGAAYNVAGVHRGPKGVAVPAADVTAVLLIAHGSRHAPANEDLHQLAARLAARGDYPIVQASFLELAEPGIVAGGDHCVARGATRVLMIPYFLSAGVHLRRDLTAARDLLGGRHPSTAFVLGPALGPDPWLDRLVLERIGQTAGLPVAAEGSASRSEGMSSDGGRRCGPAAPAAFSGAASAIDTNRSKD